MWFNKKYKDRIKELEVENKRLERSCTIFACKNHELSAKMKGSMADLMRESLGMQIDFSDADKKTCVPPHFLEGLSDEERRNFITDMETIFKNEKFQRIVKYFINMFALNMVYKVDETQRMQNQGAVVGFRTFLKEFDTMHNEFENYKKVDNDFDPLEAMPG